MSYYVESKSVYCVVDSESITVLVGGITLEKDAEQIAEALNQKPDLKKEDKIVVG
jgi:hypothetical protein